MGNAPAILIVLQTPNYATGLLALNGIDVGDCGYTSRGIVAGNRKKSRSLLAGGLQQAAKVIQIIAAGIANHEKAQTVFTPTPNIKRQSGS
jgi:hypothetical protein